MYDLIIVGGGPAGAAAGVYAARKQLKTLLITAEIGGQSTVSSEIQNWVGTTAISGEQLAKNLRDHLKAYADNILDIKEGVYATGITKEADRVTLETDEGTYSAKTLLIATGSARRKLEVPGADKFEHQGVTYCASCDGPLFSDMDVAVLGGGNAGFETVAQLVAYCKSVTLINRSNHYRADPVTVEKILANPKVTAINNSDIVEVKGDAMVSSVTYKNKTTGETKELPVQGVFIEIGQIPNTAYAKGVVDMTDYGQIKIDPRTQKTSTPGIWAAGDCTDVLYHQNNIAVGDAVRALEDIYQSIHAR